MNPPGHNFRIEKRLIATCTCGAVVKAPNYPRLDTLIAKHYDAIHQERAAS